MSVQNGLDYLYLVWKSEKSRRQYIVGILSKNGSYEFRYGKEIDAARADGFSPLVAFPDLQRVYTHDTLFPAFLARLPDKKRKNISEILQKYGLEKYDPYNLLKQSGARLPIDNFEFIDPVFDYKKPFERSFPLAGARHYLGCKGEECNNAVNVNRGDEVFLRQDAKNPKDTCAVAVYSESDNLLGYIPRYYSEGIFDLLRTGHTVNCYVKRVDMKKNCNECIILDLKVA
ncbi:MAG: HIRAN domain-containing protein [Treponema sp.]|jgi:hypothetical protein|nr:HIRAN domain-containing protein [Treponema sp.]